jgi:hypothetical protein
MLLFVYTRFLLPPLIPVAFAFLAFHYHNYWLLAVCMLIFIPTIVGLFLGAISLLELIAIAASLWRTRVAGRFTTQYRSLR